MLVLSRKANQKVNIGKDISVVVVAVKGNRVKLGLSAPNNVPIYRDELRCLHPADGQTDALTCDKTPDGIQPELRERFPPDRSP